MIFIYEQVSTRKIAMGTAEAVEQACMDPYSGQLDLNKTVALLERLIQQLETTLGHENLVRVLGQGFESDKHD